MKLKLGPVIFGGRKSDLHNVKGEKFISVLPIVTTRKFCVDIRWLHIENPWPGPMHSHGVGMWRFTLLGSYDEMRRKEGQEPRAIRQRPGKGNWIALDDFHAATNMHRKPTITIGISCFWKGTNTPQFMLDGDIISIEEYLRHMDGGEVIVDEFNGIMRKNEAS